jgi:hypothetical protein
MKKHPRDLPCHYCEQPDAETDDHVVPKAVGGPRANWNMVPCCSNCNMIKADSFHPDHCDFCAAAWDRFHHTRNLLWHAGQPIKVYINGVYASRKRGFSNTDPLPPPLHERDSLPPPVREGW